MFLNFCEIVFYSENIAVNNDFFRRFMLNHSDLPICRFADLPICRLADWRC
jgi:hypothetical protein